MFMLAGHQTERYCKGVIAYDTHHVTQISNIHSLMHKVYICMHTHTHTSIFHLDAYMHMYTGAFCLEGMSTFWGGPLWGTTHPLNPPSSAPARQKGHQSTPFWILHPFAYSLRPETELLQSYGAKTEIRMPMHIWTTRHPHLTCTAPHASIS